MFYPADRLLQIGKIFKDDLIGQSQRDRRTFDDGQHGNSDLTTLEEKETLMNLKEESSLNPILKPLFAPGIMFNSIKSGLAVDYPVFRNASTGALGHYAISQNSIKTPYVNYFINSLIPEADGSQKYSATRLENTASYTSGLGLSPIDDDRKLKILGTHQQFLLKDNWSDHEVDDPNRLADFKAVSYTHLTLPTTPYV